MASGNAAGKTQKPLHQLEFMAEETLPRQCRAPATALLTLGTKFCLQELLRSKVSTLLGVKSKPLTPKTGVHKHKCNDKQVPSEQCRNYLEAVADGELQH